MLCGTHGKNSDRNQEVQRLYQFFILPDSFGDVEEISQLVDDGTGVVEGFVGREGGSGCEFFGEDLESLLKFGERDERGAETVEELESVVEEDFVLIIFIIGRGSFQIIDTSTEKLDHETDPVIFCHHCLLLSSGRIIVIIIIIIISGGRINGIRGHAAGRIRFGGIQESIIIV